jgi:hypothetical protein
MSRPTYEKAKALVASGDKDLVARMDRQRKVDGAFRELRARSDPKKQRVGEGDGDRATGTGPLLLGK